MRSAKQVQHLTLRHVSAKDTCLRNSRAGVETTHPHRTHIKIELTSILEVDTFKVNDKMKIINYDGSLKNEATTRVMKTTFLSKDLFIG